MTRMAWSGAWARAWAGALAGALAAALVALPPSAAWAQESPPATEPAPAVMPAEGGGGAPAG
ncbi:hypothetical protein MetexDRAFT_5015, partial [Methylorubrum extorquens DSM 13060]